MKYATTLRRAFALGSAAVLAAGLAACAAPAKAPSAPAAAGAAANIAITGAWARPTAKMAMGEATATPEAKMGHEMTKTEAMGGGMHGMDGPVSAIYMVIENKGAQAETLVAVDTSVARVNEIHETKEMENGMMGMQPVQGGLQIPANGSVTLKPGGYHIMLMNLRQDLTPGQNITLTLTFQSGAQLTLDVPVKEPQ
jgi:copper(I)-binding protein